MILRRNRLRGWFLSQFGFRIVARRPFPRAPPAARRPPPATRHSVAAVAPGGRRRHTRRVCTLILLTRPGHDRPLLIAANRDEMLDRPWLKPAPHWPGQPEVVGGQDVLAGGTWLAVNAAGMVAGVLNRAGSLGPAQGRRSRGDLPLMALAHGSAAAAAGALARLDGGAWRSFNLVVADAAGAYVLRGLGAGPVTAQALAPGLHMVTASDPDDAAHPRVARHLPRFAAAPAPAPPDWGAWPGLLADAEGPPRAALNVPPTGGFGTASSALIAAGGALPPEFLFAAGRPDRASFLPVPWPPL